MFSKESRREAFFAAVKVSAAVGVGARDGEELSSPEEEEEEDDEEPPAAEGDELRRVLSACEM